MSVQAKFYVESVKLVAGGQEEQGSVTLKPVTRGAVNAEWSAATPSGEMTMWISNPAAFRWMRENLGVELRITFEVFEPKPHPFKPSANAGTGNWGHDLCGECGGSEADHPQ